MSKKIMPDKVICETPTPGKKSVQIDQWKYQCIRNAIIKVVPKKGEGLLFSELPDRVRDMLSVTDRQKLGSVAWYTTCVKLDMEVKGELERIIGVKPQRLKLKIS